MKRAQASAELVMALSALMLIFLIMAIANGAYGNTARDYADRAEAEQIAKKYASYINYVALGGSGTSIVAQNAEPGRFTIVINRTITVSTSVVSYNHPPITRNIDSDVTINGTGIINITNIGGQIWVRRIT